MRFFALIGITLGLGLVACSPDSSEEAGSASSDVTKSTPTAACSLDYWGWYLNELKPQLARPISEVSEAKMDALVAKHPPMEETRRTYSACWQPAFAEAFVGQALIRLHAGHTAFLDATSPSYRSLAAYKSNVTLTPEMRRNAKALLSLKPSTMTPDDAHTWAVTYDTIIAEAIEPVGVPGPNRYEGVVENEWIIDDAEAEYLAIAEAAQAAPSEDGNYSEWFRSTEAWILGPPRAVSNSFVFHLTWEPASVDIAYDGLVGVEMVAGEPTIPAPVQAFLDRRKKTQPKAIGEEDSAAWMNWYHARGIRTIGDLRQNQPMLTKTDTLALDVLETMKPDVLRGAFTFKTWLDLADLANGQADRQWLTRFAAFEPCLDAADLPQAQRDFAAKLPKTTIPAPRACAAK